MPMDFEEPASQFQNALLQSFGCGFELCYKWKKDETIG